MVSIYKFWIYKTISRPGVDKSLEWDFIKVILTKNQGRSEGDKKRMQIGKSRYVELNRTYCCTKKFNMALSLYRVLRIVLYFSKSFLEAAARELAVAKALWPLGVTMVYFLGWESNLWSPVL